MDWLSRLDKGGTVAEPPAVPALPGEEAPEPEQHDEYPETAEAKTARLARLGQTPIREVYYTEYTDKNLFPKLADIRCFTHVNVGHGRFVNKLTGEGLEIPSETQRLLKEMVAFKAQYPELKVKLMIGGWGKNANGFSPMAADPVKRAAFVQNVKAVIDEYKLDGVDIDWEYPTYHAEGNEASPDDYVNFVTMFKELREAMPDKILSYAAPENGKYTDNYGALEYVDYINVMTYDMGNPQDRRHNAPLYTSPALKNDHGAADSIEKTFHGQGVPFGRMNFGIGFYGHGDGYKDENGYYPGSVDYYRLEDIFFKNTCDGKDVSGKNFRIWDDNAKVPYLADAMGTMYASYEDIESVNAKVAFILEKQLLGAMVWEYRHDNVKGTLRRALRDAMAGNPMEPGRWERPDENLPEPEYVDPDVPVTPDPGFDPDAMPVLGSYTRKVFDSGMNELSGLCFSKDSSFIWGVGDEGTLYHIDIADNVENMTYKVQFSHSADMEDVTLDPATGDLYVAIEGEQKMYKIPAPGYNSYSTVFYVQEAVDMKIGNDGLEGCTMYKDGKIFIGCQYGANLWTYDLKGNKLGRVQLGTLAPNIKEVGGLCYDFKTDKLWVTDSEAFKLFVFDGALTKKFAEFDISFVGNPESVLVDHKRKCIWVGDDGSTSKIYKISCTGL